ncbi:FAD-dependent oxidoreductase [Afifella pfennigii]|uniref:FAD-dependent oxidoreductase n=1 Tax=Afifella pfennigii TaxID=209897 RepID=UPI00068AD289|nr:FAD-dependent oxidoreductase [Afifella pfennigii]
MRIAVAGAGIAGLTAALTLARAGSQVTLYERSERLEEVGAGIQLSPNASRLLIAMGLGEPIRAIAFAPQCLRLGDGRKLRQLASLPLGDWAERRYGAPYLLVHRADLQDVLTAAIGEEESVRLRLGKAVTDIEPQADSISFLAEGQREEADLLVGADGLRSAIRRRLLHGREAAPSAYVAWRATIPMEAAPEWLPRDGTCVWMGPGWHMVHYPIRRGARLNLVAIERPIDRTVRPTLPGGAREIAALVGLVDEVTQWLPWTLSTVDAEGPWTGERTVIIGDAAHAMLPTAAQGGAMAIEDAVALAWAISRPGPLAERLSAYVEARRKRIAAVAAMAQANLRVYAMFGPAAQARNLVLSSLPGALLMRRQDWLYSFTG